ncbi:MAG: AAA family ATPase [Terracidiphilus sp.]|nr:AAA family ATPase [Terracidiphilus sp.]
MAAHVKAGTRPPPGCVCVCGPPGSGKSSLVRAVTQSLQRDAGALPHVVSEYLCVRVCVCACVRVCACVCVCV